MASSLPSFAQEKSPQTNPHASSPAGESGEVQISHASHILCRNKKVVRTVSIQKIAEGCQTVYNKNGVDQIVGGGKFLSTCRKQLSTIKHNLESAGWKCQEHASMDVLSSEASEPSEQSKQPDSP